MDWIGLVLYEVIGLHPRVDSPVTNRPQNDFGHGLTSYVNRICFVFMCRESKPKRRPISLACQRVYVLICLQWWRVLLLFAIQFRGRLVWYLDFVAVTWGKCIAWYKTYCRCCCSVCYINEAFCSILQLQNIHQIWNNFISPITLQSILQCHIYIYIYCDSNIE